MDTKVLNKYIDFCSEQSEFTSASLRRTLVQVDCFSAIAAGQVVTKVTSNNSIDHHFQIINILLWLRYS